MEVKLLEKPNRLCTGRYYQVTIGKVYTVLGTFGSCFLVLDDSGENAYIATHRFEVQPT